MPQTSGLRIRSLTSQMADLEGWPYALAMTEARFDRITVDPARLGGKATIRGLRISVEMVVQMVTAGKSTQEIVAEYPYLEPEDVQQALAYAAAHADQDNHLAPRAT